MLILFVIYRAMRIMVQSYIVCSIITVSNSLRISSRLAGATFLSLANGFTDVVTAVVSSELSNGVYIGLSSLMGSGLFVYTVILGTAILKSPQVYIFSNKKILTEFGFYFLAVLIILIFGIFGGLNSLFCIVFGGLYLLYTLIETFYWVEEKGSF